MPVTATDSRFRGFVLPGTGVPFSLDSGPLGFDEGYWSNPNGPLAGQQLDGFMQQVVSGVTGIPGNLVRPRWQPEPPNLPQDPNTNPGTPSSIDWAAIGVVSSTPLGFPYNSEVITGRGLVVAQGFSQQSDQEEFDLLCSFYGLRADNYAVKLRAGLIVAQNRECLQLTGMGLVNTSGRRRVPSLVQNQNLMRVDITVTFRREVREQYPIMYYLSAPAVLTTDTGVTDNIHG